MKRFYLETKRLIIKPMHASMAEAVHRLSRDDDNRRFVPDEVFETVEDAADTIKHLISCYDKKDGPFVYAVTLLSGESVGHVQLVKISDGWEIGYHIGKDFTGNGYATEAITAFVPEVLFKVGESKLFGICLSENAASRRVLEKCGFFLMSDTDGTYQGEPRKVAKYMFHI